MSTFASYDVAPVGMAKSWLHPRINRRFYVVERTVAGGCGMRVVVEIVVDFEVEVAEAPYCR